MRALLELYRANLTEFLSNRRALFLTIAFPVLFIVIFGLVFTNQDKQDAKVGVVNLDPGPLGGHIASALLELPKVGGDTEKNPFSSMEFRAGGEAAFREDLKAGRLDAMVIIPADATARLGGGQPTGVQMHIDLSRQTLIPVLQGAVSNVLDRVESGFTGKEPLLNLETVPTRARDLRTIDYLLPGILAMSIMQIGLFATAQPLIALRVGGVLKRLGATPLPRSTLLVAYVALRLTVAILQTALIIAIGTLAFKVNVVGSWWALGGWLLLGTLTFLAIGFFMAAVAKNEESAIAAANVINLPMLLLSGIFFPVNHLPKFLNWIIDLIPLNYLADALRHTMVDAAPQHTMQTNALALGAWIVVMTALAVHFFKWEESR